MADIKFWDIDVERCPYCGHPHKGMQFEEISEAKEPRINGVKKAYAVCPYTLKTIIAETTEVTALCLCEDQSKCNCKEAL